MSTKKSPKSPSKVTEDELEKARQKLLDLTLRNRLINFTPTKTSTIKVIDEVPREVYGRIVLEEKSMEFRFTPDSSETEDSELFVDYQNGDSRDLWSLEDAEIKPQYVDKYLQTNLSMKDLQRRLFSIHQKSRTVFEEQGYTVLYLALGFLEWKENPSSDIIHKAPIILIPVELERRAVGSAYCVKWTNDDIFTNVSLQSKLNELGVILPDFETPEEKSQIDSYAESVSRAVSLLKDWRVNSDIYLGFFNFTKFVMYRDLESKIWPNEHEPSKHKLLMEVFGVENSLKESMESEENLEEISKIRMRDQFLVLDADSSQISVIENAKKGLNLVVEGPPGTGKSQTITNLIAELLVMGKSVLFVSEKMAALEVVKIRLDNCGLGEACIELHSRHSSKRSFLNTLKATIEALPPKDISNKINYDEHEDLTLKLNEYIRALREPFGKMNKSPYNYICLHEKARDKLDRISKKVTSIKITDVKSLTTPEYQQNRRILQQLTDVLPDILPMSQNSWRFCKPEDIVPADVDEIEKLLLEHRTILNKILSTLAVMNQLCHTGAPDNERGLLSSLEGARFLATDRFQIEKDVLLNPDWNERNKTAVSLIDGIARVDQERGYFHNLFNPVFPTSFLRDLAKLLTKCGLVITNLQNAFSTLNKLCATVIPLNANKSKDVIDAAIIIANYFPVEKEILTNQSWDSSNIFVHNILENIAFVQKEKFYFEEQFSSDISGWNYSEILSTIQQIRLQIRQLQDRVTDLDHLSAIGTPDDLKSIKLAIQAAKCLSTMISIDRNILKSSVWNLPDEKVDELLNHIECVQANLDYIQCTFIPGVLSENHASIKQKLESKEGKISRFLSFPYFISIYKAKRLYKEKSPSQIRQILSDMDRLELCKKLLNLVGENSAFGRSHFGIYWKGDSSDISILRKLSKCLPNFTHEYLQGHFTERVFDFIEMGSSKEKIDEAIKNVDDSIKTLYISLSEITRIIGIIKLAPSKLSWEEITLDEWINILNVWSKNIASLSIYSKWRNYGISSSIPQRSITDCIYKLPNFIKAEKLQSDLDRLSIFTTRLTSIYQESESAKSLFGKYWKAEYSDTNMLTRISCWILEFRKHLIKGSISEKAVEIITTGPKVEEILQIIHDLHNYLNTVEELTHNIFGSLGLETFYVSDNFHEEMTLDRWLSIIDFWSEKLELISIYISHSGHDAPSSTTPKSLIKAIYKQVSPSWEEVLCDLNRLESYLNLIKEIENNRNYGIKLFGRYWQGTTSDIELLIGLSIWIPRFRSFLKDGIIKETVSDLISTGLDRRKIIDTVMEIENFQSKYHTNEEEIKNKICFQQYPKEIMADDQVSFKKLLNLVDDWITSVHKLPRWSQWISLRDLISKTPACSLIELIESDSISSEEIVPLWDVNVAGNLLRSILQERPILRSFIGEVHERTVSNFVDVDRNIITLNRQLLARKIFEMRPKLSGGSSPNSEAGIIIGQINRKRGHLPIRQLIKRAGCLIQKIKPCFMMSPLSIAQFFDPQSLIQFDVIVFDEASQVRPEDALGALLRGRQLIVMGDTRQLPPTSFFDKVGMDEISDEEDDGSEGFTSVAEVESILHQCSRSFPVKTLKWHYRSRHESLIALSNQEFYQNRLFVYPSSAEKVPYLGLEFAYNPGSIYDRGRSSTNRIEAQILVESVFKHYQQFPEKSLGVGAFSVKQQQSILEEIEYRIRANPELETCLSHTNKESFFVKNLETIQGDERDVIFISMGYGFDKEHRLSKNFGPLNKEGGERRLNVLITRARERCVLFSNFRAQDLTIENTDPKGLDALRKFMDFAENRNLISLGAYQEDSESPFEDLVYGFLVSKGYQVRKQIGCAGYRVDLAIVNSIAPGKYLIGIECDGAKYHLSPVARDRDRLRQTILENLGWRIHRIWSTDWFRNRLPTQERLIKAIEQANTDLKQNDGKAATQRRNHVPKQPLTIQRESKYDQESEKIDDQVPLYQACKSIGISTLGNLHEISPSLLAKAVTEVVKIEAPVHKNEVIHRIRATWGLHRTGNRIVIAVERGIEVAKQMGQIERRGSFLWLNSQSTINIRRRTTDPAPKIDLICDEEIIEAVRFILKKQYATDKKELAEKTARLFGFLSLHDQTLTRITKLINELIQNGTLKQLISGLINLN